MKKFIFSTVMLCVCLLGARGVDNNSNMSAEYIRTATRNAATDMADAAYYNPAGTPYMKDGTYVYFSNQFMFKNYKQTVEGSTYSADNPTLLIPSFYTVLSHKDSAVFMGFNIPGGGGSVEYDDGVALTHDYLSNMGMDVDSVDISIGGEVIYYSWFAGFAHSFKDIISVSAALRFIHATQSREGKGVFPSGMESGYVIDSTADGMGAYFGLALKPMENLLISTRFETPITLNWNVEKIEDELNLLDGVEKGYRYRRDLPPVFGVGISYTLLERLRFEGSFNLYINKAVRWDDLDSQEKEIQRKYNTGFDAGLTIEYQIIKMLKASIGLVYGRPGEDTDSFYEVNPNLNGPSVTAGFLFEPTEKLGFSIGVLKTIYESANRKFPGDATRNQIKLDKDIWIIALGAQTRF